MPTVFRGDRAIHVETDGDDRRPAVVLINPLGTTTRIWDPMIETFVAHNWVIRFDLPGHGELADPELPVTPYSIADLGLDVLEVLDSLEVDRAHLVGASLGGMAALWVAAEHPDRVDRVVAASTGPVLGSYHWWERTITTVEAEGMSAIADHLESILYSPTWRDARPDDLAEARAQLLSTPADAYIAGARAVQDADVGRLATRVRASTLLIIGEDDPVLAHHPPTDLLASIPDAEAVSVSGAGHRVLL